MRAASRSARIRSCRPHAARIGLCTLLVVDRNQINCYTVPLFCCTATDRPTDRPFAAVFERTASMTFVKGWPAAGNRIWDSLGRPTPGGSSAGRRTGAWRGHGGRGSVRKGRGAGSRNITVRVTTRSVLSGDLSHLGCCGKQLRRQARASGAGSKRLLSHCWLSVLHLPRSLSHLRTAGLTVGTSSASSTLSWPSAHHQLGPSEERGRSEHACWAGAAQHAHKGAGAATGAARERGSEPCSRARV